MIRSSLLFAALSVVLLSPEARASEAEGKWVPLASLLPGVPPAAIGPGAPADEDDKAADEKKQLAKKRASLRTLHRAFGITTWVSLAATNVLGTARYANVVGFGTPRCESGSPIFGEKWGCGDGLKVQHLVSASFTTLSYATTRTIAALMPDPYGAAEGDDWTAKRLRWHRALSWVHLAGMIAMPILGLATSSAEGQARDNLATAHLVTGWTTFAAVTAAGSLMVF
ncbi:MAG: hypothetical protein HYV09_16700 [Deltaproteobacteria bacterium]|nr:hypothetical protein [Deltaproteobacteria bacterium]